MIIPLFVSRIQPPWGSHYTVICFHLIAFGTCCSYRRETVMNNMSSSYVESIIKKVLKSPQNAQKGLNSSFYCIKPMLSMCLETQHLIQFRTRFIKVRTLELVSYHFVVVLDCHFNPLHHAYQYYPLNKSVIYLQVIFLMVLLAELF